MKEADILQLCRIAASECGATVWRNNQGAYEKDGYHIKYGVCNPGGSDLIGIYKGRFLALEVKKPGGRVTTEQAQFIEYVNRAGGIAGIVYSPDDVKKLLT